jgi:alpha-amylase
MKDKLQSLFGKTPEGVWLTERVWDPELVAPLKRSGVCYTVLDDLHFENAGIAAPVTGFYQARSGRDVVDLFASLMRSVPGASYQDGISRCALGSHGPLLARLLMNS